MLPRVRQFGELKHMVALEKRVLAQAGGAAGTGLTESFTVVADAVFAKIEGLPGGRYVAGGAQIEEAATHVGTIRHRADPSLFDHLRGVGGRRFKVLQADDPDGERCWTEMQLQALS